jgi:hypothetical protein
MNLRTSLLLLSIAMVLGGIGLSIHQGRQFVAQVSATAAGEKFLPKFDLNAVSKITVKTNNSTATLEKTDSGWTVVERANYPADFAAVGDLVRRLWNFKPAQDVIAGPSQFARLELLEPDGEVEGAGTFIELADADGKRLAAVVVGKQSFAQPDPDSPFPPSSNGRFIVIAGAEGPVGVAAEGFDLIRDKPDMWIDREFVKIGPVKSLALDAPDKKWRATRPAASTPWALDNAPAGEQTDSTKLDPIATMFANPGFNDIAVEVPDSAFQNPATLVVENFDGFTTTFTIGERDGDSYPAKVEVTAKIPEKRKPAQDENPEDTERLDKEFAEKTTQLREDLEKTKKFASHIFKMPAQVIEMALKPRDELLAPKAPATEPPTE